MDGADQPECSRKRAATADTQSNEDDSADVPNAGKNPLVDPSVDEPALKKSELCSTSQEEKATSTSEDFPEEYQDYSLSPEADSIVFAEKHENAMVRYIMGKFEEEFVQDLANEKPLAVTRQKRCSVWSLLDPRLRTGRFDPVFIRISSVYSFIKKMFQKSKDGVRFDMDELALLTMISRMREEKFAQRGKAGELLEAMSNFEVLPTELKARVFSFMSTNHVLQFRNVSRAFYHLTDMALLDRDVDIVIETEPVPEDSEGMPFVYMEYHSTTRDKRDILKFVINTMANRPEEHQLPFANEVEKIWNFVFMMVRHRAVKRLHVSGYGDHVYAEFDASKYLTPDRNGELELYHIDWLHIPEECGFLLNLLQPRHLHLRRTRVLRQETPPPVDATPVDVVPHPLLAHHTCLAVRSLMTNVTVDMATLSKLTIPRVDFYQPIPVNLTVEGVLEIIQSWLKGTRPLKKFYAFCSATFSREAVNEIFDHYRLAKNDGTEVLPTTAKLTDEVQQGVILGRSLDDVKLLVTVHSCVHSMVESFGFVMVEGPPFKLGHWDS